MKTRGCPRWPLFAALGVLVMCCISTGHNANAVVAQQSEGEALASSVVGDATSAARNINTVCPRGLVFVAGATGRVGSEVTRRLLDDGHCVRILTRNATRAREVFPAHANDGEKFDVVVGQLGDGKSVASAFNRTADGGMKVKRVVFAAGGESADFGMVNDRGVAECATSAANAGGVESMVVISAAWVSKPFSLASVLFNSLYGDFPMARHLQGEDALREASYEGRGLSYVILRAGKLVNDEEYPSDAPPGLTYQQGDNFTFFGPAGVPGMSTGQLANAVLTAMNVVGRYTVEVTGGTTSATDVAVYSEFQEDTSMKENGMMYTYDDVTACHLGAIMLLRKMIKYGVVLFILIPVLSLMYQNNMVDMTSLFGMSGVLSMVFGEFIFFILIPFTACSIQWTRLSAALLFVLCLALSGIFWSVYLSDISVLHCAEWRRKMGETMHTSEL